MPRCFFWRRASAWAPLWTRRWEERARERRDERRHPLAPWTGVWWVLLGAGWGPRLPAASSPVSAQHDAPQGTTSCGGKSDDTRVQILALSPLWYLNDHASLMSSESSNRKKLSLSNYFRSVKLIEITQSPHELLIYSTATLHSPRLPLNSHKLSKSETEQLGFQLLIFICFAVSQMFLWTRSLQVSERQPAPHNLQMLFRSSSIGAASPVWCHCHRPTAVT